MLKSISFFLIALFCSFNVLSQTTDLSINIEAQNLSGTAVSQVDIYEDFQYLITISNSGNSVNNATISIDFDDDLTILSSNSQNNSNGATAVTNIVITDNVLTASIDTMPNNSSVELLVLVTAPTNLGGIAANGSVSPPAGTTDTNTTNNQSIISIDVLDIIIDFEVTHIQIDPTPGNAISAWGDEVTYLFTITNNSEIDFPVERIEGVLLLASAFDNGQPFAEFVSINCVEATNGTLCPDLSDVEGFSNAIISPNLATAPTLFEFNNAIEFTTGGSITFEMVYRYTNFSCSPDPMPIEVDSFIQIGLNHANASSNTSNGVTTNLLNADECPLTDVCIETVQIDPLPGQPIGYNENVTFETTICNNGPSEAPILAFMQNLSSVADWDIISVNCTETTGPVDCADFTIFDNDQLWVTNNFVLQPNTTITIVTVVEFIEPPCSPFPNQVEVTIKSEVVLDSTPIVDTNPDNNFFFNLVELPQEEPCDGGNSSDLTVVKTQISPELPIGSTSQNTAEWGEVTYEVTVTNNGDTDEPIQVQDHMPVPGPSSAPITGTLVSVNCTNTTGTANCFDIINANVGVVFDGVTEDGSFDTFWEILPEDNFILAANSSVTYTVVVDWQPECASQPILGENIVRGSYIDRADSDTTNNIDNVRTYFAPCIDLVVQTFPEFTQVDTNQTFNWIIDVSNSTTSSEAVDVLFENTLNSEFTIAGTPTCSVTLGNATCASSFSVNGNVITGTIPSMDAESTVRIIIPVIAPSFGGAFNNTAQAFPNPSDNEELVPETNISINSVQVISPVLDKFFLPDTIFEGGESELIFTVFNIAGNPTQSNISFIDNLPQGVTLSASPNWVAANGCTANFSGTSGDNFVGITDLVFPAGVESCTFSVMVTSNAAGIYLNNFDNFTNTNNIDTSQTSATLNVIVDTSNVDIEILKSVEPTEAIIGENVLFTITATNLGTTSGTALEIIDLLPLGYTFVSASATNGVFDNSTLTWSISELLPNNVATLIIEATVISSNNLLNVALLNSLNEIDRDPSNNQDEALVERSNCLNVPEGISPNNDLLNDSLVIPCIESYPDNALKIFNRYGTLVYQSNNYLNTWDGRANTGFPSSSKLLPVGTYFYILEIEDIEKPIQGYIYLNY